MRIIIEIKGVTFKDVQKEGQQKFELETDCFYSFQEIAKCIINSGYIVKAYKMFDGND